MYLINRFFLIFTQLEFTAVEISNLINGQIIGIESVKGTRFSPIESEKKGAFVILLLTKFVHFLDSREFNSYLFPKDY